MSRKSRQPSVILIMLKGITIYGPRTSPRTTDKKPSIVKGRAQHGVRGRNGVGQGETGWQKRSRNLVQ